MSEFTEKLNSSGPVSNAWDEIDKGQADAGLLFDTISNEFKDWQPPKPREIPVEIPQRFADWFEEKMAASFLSVVSAYCFSDDEDIKWIRDNGGLDLLCKMKLYGYTVEKEQMFYLKNVMTNNYLMQHKLDFRFGESDSKEDSLHWQTKFNQSEIDGMKTGSYERIEVDK